MSFSVRLAELCCLFCCCSIILLRCASASIQSNTNVRVVLGDTGAAGVGARIKIGAFMTDDSLSTKRNEKATIEQLLHTFNQSHELRTRFDIKLTVLPAVNTFRAAKYVCNGLLRDGVVALLNLDDENSATSSYLKELSEAVHLPYFSSYWDKRDHAPYEPHEFSISTHPSWPQMARAFQHLVDFVNWNRFVLVYENPNVLSRMSAFITVYLNANKLTLAQLPRSHDAWKPFLQQMNHQNAYKFLIDTSTRNLKSFLETALQVGLLSRDKEFLFTNMDLATVNLDKYIWLDVNISAFQLVDASSARTQSLARHWMAEEFKGRASPLENDKTFRTNCALIFDSVWLIVDTFRTVHAAAAAASNGTAAESYTLPRSISCHTNASRWSDASAFVQRFRQNVIDGSTGTMMLDRRGNRDNFTLNLVTLNRNGLEKVGEWSSATGILSVTGNVGFDLKKPDTGDKRKRHLLVVVVLEKPYVSLKRDADQYVGNDKYEGFCVDLLISLAEICNFKYTIYQEANNTYGSPNEAGEWNGLIREIITGKADIALASLTINVMRSNVIHMTKPFLNLGISILFKKPEPRAPSLFSFMAPLSSHIWLYMFLAYLVFVYILWQATSLVMFVNSRFSPFEWSKLKHCNAPSNMVHNQFTLNNAFWYVVTSFIHMGIDMNPRAPSTRMLNCAWSLFSLILTASYTANLAAFLTVKNVEMPINSAEDLSMQTDIKYGCLKGGSSEAFFRESKIATYERMWKFMKSDASMMTSMTHLGIERVRQGNYAYLLESTSNEYARMRDCNLTQVGDLLDSKSYGFGMPLDSPWKEDVSDAILFLQENGRIHQFYDKWWRQIGAVNCETSAAANPDHEGDAMTFSNVGGIFVVLVVGIVLSCLVALLEFVWKIKKHPTEEKKFSVEWKKSLKSFAELSESMSDCVRCRRRGNSQADGESMEKEAPSLTGYLFGGDRLLVVASARPRRPTSQPTMRARVVAQCGQQETAAAAAEPCRDINNEEEDAGDDIANQINSSKRDRLLSKLTVFSPFDSQV